MSGAEPPAPPAIVTDSPPPAIARGKPPAERSLNATISSFSRDDFLRDPAGYCAQSIPVRVDQMAAPGATVPQITIVGRRAAEVAVGQSVVLSVKAEPGMPVSWFSPQGGIFAPANRNAITVQADDTGAASATWVATPGTIGFATVLAACPTCSGRAELSIHVADSSGN
jgi:hypothetical protein